MEDRVCLTNIVFTLNRDKVWCANTERHADAISGLFQNFKFNQQIPKYPDSHRDGITNLKLEA